MQVHEFYGKYANVPAKDRDVVVMDGYTLSELYFQFKDADKKRGEYEREMWAIIQDTEKFILEHQAFPKPQPPEGEK